MTRQSCPILVLLILNLTILSAESLWDKDSPGYFSSESQIKEGDVLQLIIEDGTVLELEASSVDQREVNLDFKGGNIKEIMDFLPKPSGGIEEEKNNQFNYKIESRMAVNLSEKINPKLFRVQGSKKITIDGVSESITVSGILPLSRVQEDGSFYFTDLAESSLVYTSFLSDQPESLSSDDLVKPSPPPAPSEEETAEGEEEITETAGEEEAGTEVTPVPSPSPSAYVLSEEKEKEILVRYLNRFLNGIF